MAWARQEWGGKTDTSGLYATSSKDRHPAPAVAMVHQMAFGFGVRARAGQTGGRKDIKEKVQRPLVVS